MANLGSYQKISRVLAGKPFGNGVDGDLTISSNTTQSQTVQSCSGSSTQKDLTIASGAFTNGDVVLIHQTRGTGVGQWEINKVASGGGTTTLTMQENLQYTYTDSGASQAQVIKIPLYKNVTVNSGITWSAPAWDGNVGGILLFAANGTVTITGTISAISGFVGGTGSSGTANCGEGSANVSYATQNANGNGGGGGYRNPGVSVSGGGGGGNGANGTTGEAKTGAPGGTGGSASGAADLTTITFGGAGGGGTRSTTPYASGGKGGSMVIIFAKSITITGTINTNGTNGENGTAVGSGGGGGAGGSVLIACQTATLDTNKITALAGNGGTGAHQGENNAGNGGAGAIGRIALHYSSSYTGSTNPALTAIQDGTLVETEGAGFLWNFV